MTAELAPEGRRVRTLLLAVVVVLALVGLRRGCQVNELSFASKVTGLPLPERPSRYFGHDDGEMSLSVAMALSPDEQSRLLATGRFHSPAHGCAYAAPHPSRLFRAESFPPGFREVEATSPLLHASGCPPHQSWVALLEPSTGRLWVQVLYPDHSGDDPGCDACSPDGASSPPRSPSR